MSFDALCRRVLECDTSMRSVRIADGLGRVAGSAYRSDLAHMNDDEAEAYSLQSVIRAMMRENFLLTNGRLRYSVSVYENLTRATVPLGQDGAKFYLLVSLEAGADAHAVIGRVLAIIADVFSIKIG